MASATITIQTVANVPLEKAWMTWTKPEHIMQWNHASDDWHSPRASSDLREGGRFNYRMEATNGSAGFDFCGTFETIIANKLLVFIIDDGRKVSVTFSGNKIRTKIVEQFEAEHSHSMEMQRKGWQAILDNFKSYAETVK